MGIGFGWLGFLATKYLLACCLLRSIFGTMGLGFTWNFIQDVSNGDWGRAVLNAFGAITSFLGASTNFYQGGGLGNHGGGSSSGVVADDAAGAADDVANVVDDATNVASDTRTNHILYGDETGGGHLWPGQQGKSSFPQNWDANTVMKNISDIATDPTLTWTPGRVINGVQRYEVVGVRDGIAIKVITDANDIITAFPIG